jgi:dTDP-4-amino-4,6-dideoxygalactose transaminase
MTPELPELSAIAPYLQRIDENRWYSNFGPLVRELESRLATTFPRDSEQALHVVTVSTATAGIELALRALELPPGAPVLVPAVTFVATAVAALSAGLMPIVADVDARSWLLTPAIATDALKRAAIRAVVPVATFGCPQNTQGWDEFHQRTGVPVVIDAAAGFGNQDGPGPTCAVFSLHATKPLAAGEGGFVVTRSPAFAGAIRQLSNFGINLTDPSIAPIGTTTVVGTNSKLSEYHAAVGLASLDQWPQNAARRRLLYREYASQLASIRSLPTAWQVMPEASVRSVCCFLVESATVRERAEAALAAAGIGTRRWYLPTINRHPAFRDLPHLPSPNAEVLAARLLGVPFSIGLSAAARREVVDALAGAA